MLTLVYSGFSLLDWTELCLYFSQKKNISQDFSINVGKHQKGHYLRIKGHVISKELCVLVPTACDEIICQAQNCMHNVALMGLNMVEL